MRLILIRHGQTQSNIDRLLDTGHPGAPLTQTGHDQAALLAQRLAAEPIEAIYTSDLTRAHQTGKPLAQRLGIDVITDSRLREIFAGDHDMADDFGPYLAVLEAWRDDPDACLENGETGTQFMERFDQVVADIAASGVTTAAIVSHGAALRVWAPARAINVDHDTTRQWRLDNTDVVVLEQTDDGWHLVAWADVTLT